MPKKPQRMEGGHQEEGGCLSDQWRLSSIASGKVCLSEASQVDIPRTVTGTKQE